MVRPSSKVNDQSNENLGVETLNIKFEGVRNQTHQSGDKSYYSYISTGRARLSSVGKLTFYNRKNELRWT